MMTFCKKQFLRKRRSLHIQIICQLLPVKRDRKLPALRLQGYCIQIGHDAAADGSWRCMKTAACQMKIFSGNNSKQVGREFGSPGLCAARERFRAA